MGCIVWEGAGEAGPALQGILGEKGEEGTRIQAAVELRGSDLAAGTNTPRAVDFIQQQFGTDLASAQPGQGSVTEGAARCH